MRAISRELFVGGLFLLTVMAGGCQPLQPVARGGVGQTGGMVGREPLTETVTLVESQPVTVSETLTDNVSAPSGEVTESPVVDTSSMPEQAASDVDPALLESGLAVYRAQYCGVCHTLDAAQTRGTFGPPHNGMGQIAVERLADAAYSGAATTPAEYVAESIVDPQAYTVPGYEVTSHRMPVYAHLDQASVDALVAFLLAH